MRTIPNCPDCLVRQAETQDEPQPAESNPAPARELAAQTEVTTENLDSWMDNDEDIRGLKDTVILDIRANLARQQEAHDRERQADKARIAELEKKLAEFEEAAGEAQGIDEENHHLKLRVRELEADLAKTGRHLQALNEGRPCPDCPVVKQMA